MVPIFPYAKNHNARYLIHWQLLLLLYIGFGLGVASASLAVSPFWLIREDALGEMMRRNP
jgi:hypothetical protein